VLAFVRAAAPWQALAAAQRARLAPGHDNTLTATERRIADLVAAPASSLTSINREFSRAP
jgi:hypothetical protein